MAIENDIKQTNFESEQQKMMLNIMYTAEVYNREMNKVFKQFSITAPQFNILRILAGSNPKPLSPSDIKTVMIFSSSDITRLLDRLEKKELINRILCPTNRRKMDLGITKIGLDLLDKINPIILETSKQFYQDLTEKEAKQVSSVLDKLRP